jgi:hypothetical protein
MRRIVALIGAVIGTATLSNCNGFEDAGPATLPVGFSVAFNGPVVLPQGGSVDVPVSIVRLPGFTGEVLITAQVDVIGIQVSSEIISANATTTTLKVTSDGLAGPGPSLPFTVIGVALDYAPVTVSRTMSIVAAGTFQFAHDNGLDGPVASYANPGFTFRRTIRIERAGYTLPVTFTAQSSTGFPTRITPATTTGDSTIVEVDVPTSASTLGLFEVNMTATGTDGRKDTKGSVLLIRSPSFTLYVGSPVSPIANNEIGVAIITILRDPGFSAPVEISLDPAEGITAEPTLIPSGSSTLPLLINVASNAPTGTNQLVDVRAKSPGIADVTSTLHVDVAGFTLGVRHDPLTMYAGTTAADTVNITRTLFFTPIALVGSGPTGITAHADSVVTAGNLAIMSVSVPSSVPVGRYSVTLTGKAGQTAVSKTFALDVIQPPTTTSPTMSVNPQQMSLSQGRTTTIAAVVTNGLSGTDVTWTTKDASIASISDNGSRSVTVSGVEAGSSTYIVGSFAYSGGTSRDSTLVTVTNGSTAAVDHITLEPDSIDVTKGQQVQYRVRFWNASNVEMNAEVGATIMFTEDVSSVAQINATTGLLTTRGVGVTPVTASYRMPYYDDLKKASLIGKGKVVVH